jgi:hypothetical protein
VRSSCIIELRSNLGKGNSTLLAKRGRMEKRERNEVINMPEAETAEIYEILDGYGIDPEASSAFVEALLRNPEKRVQV